MNRDNEQIDQKQPASASQVPGSGLRPPSETALMSGNARGSDTQSRRFAYSRSPSASGGGQGSIGAGIRRPTIFQRSDSVEGEQNKNGSSQNQQATTAATNTAQGHSSKPPLTSSANIVNPIQGNSLHETSNSGSAVETVATLEAMRTPRQLRKGSNRDTILRDSVESNLLATPSASEKKSMLNSLLSEEDGSIIMRGGIAETSASNFYESGAGGGSAAIQNSASSSRATAVSRSGRKKQHNRLSMASLSTTAQKDNVKVVIRVRPINERERAGGPTEKVKLCLSVERNEKVVLDRGMETKTFTFDFVATQDSEQQTLFEKIARPIADSCLQGYNGSIFAYGQTGSGKTYTIQGPTMTVNGEETLIGASNTSTQMQEKRGLMQRSFEYMFDCMERQKAEARDQGVEMQFLVKTSYLEIYNEQIMDLLDPQSYNLHVREDIKKGVYVESLNEETVTSVKDMMNLTSRGARNRHVGSTLMNKESSRSHSVLTTTIESKTMDEGGTWQMKSSRFHIIDLAGSERSKATNAVGERLKEAGMINKSLTALGIVINSLVEISEGKNRHVHYRDSKLTFLLRDSLGGNSKTVIIANVTAAAISVGETLSTLKFAQRAKLIKNKAIINEESSSTIHLLKQELRRTKKDLAEQTNQLKIAHEQLAQMHERIPESLHEHSMNESQALCKVCKKEVGGDDDVNLHFTDNSAVYYSNGGAAKQGDDSSLLGDLMNDKTPGGSAVGLSSLQNNPKAFKLYKQRATELVSMKDRVSKVEKLLSENLENMDIQQRQHEQEVAMLTKSNKDKQTALEASEKNRARDKMIIKFREERIAELESRLAKAEQSALETAASSSDCQTDNCSKCESLQRDLADAHMEIAQWVECADKNPQAAKLFAEKEDLLAAKKQLQGELGVSPESLTARIRGLNELTSDLNAYLKEYCLSEGFDRLKQELEATNAELAQKVVSLETDLADKENSHSEKVRCLSDQHEAKAAQLSEKIESLKETFESEKVKIEQTAADQMSQLKADLDATMAEKGELQKEIYDKVKAHEEKLLLQKSIDSLNKTLEDLRAQKESLETQLVTADQERESLEEAHRRTEQNLSEQNLQLQTQLETEKAQLNQTLKEVSQKANQEIQDLEKEVAAAKEENRMHEEKGADLERKINLTQAENDALQKQVLETSEEIQEKRRHVKEIETKLNSTIRDVQTKSEQIQQFTRDANQTTDKLLKITNELEQSRTDSCLEVQGLQQKLTILNSEKDEQVSLVGKHSLRIAELEQSEQLLKGKVALSEGKVEQCAKYEVQQQVLSKQVQVFEQEIAQMTLKLNSVTKESQEKAQDLVSAHEQLVAMEELTVSLTKQVQEHDAESSRMKASLVEKDLQVAQSIREADSRRQEVSNSLAEEQSATRELKAELSGLKDALARAEASHAQLQAEKSKAIAELTDQVQKQKACVKAEEKKLEEAQIKVEQICAEQQRMVEEVKQTMKKEKQNIKFELELAYETKVQNKETEMRQAFATNQSSQQEVVSVQQSEIQQLRMALREQKQAKQRTLLNLQEQIGLLRRSQQELVSTMEKELTWKRVGPKVNVIQSLVEHVKNIQKEHAALKSFQQDCQELREQLAEYKGLTQQLQEEKQSLNARLHENLGFVETAKVQNSEIIDSLNAQLQTTQTELAEAHQMLTQQRAVTEESLRTLNKQKVEQIERVTEENRQVVSRLQDEAEHLRVERGAAQAELLKYKTKSSEQSHLLISSKETISSMMSKENQLMSDLKRKISELGEQQEHYKARVTHSKQEKEALASKYETLRKENENLRELVKIKDGQIEDSRGYEQERRGDRERIYAELRKTKEMLQKRENEIKDVVLTLKAFADEKKRLEKELERLRSAETQIGHNNQAQKIQHHLRIKEENNKLKEDNYALQDQVRRLLAQGSTGTAQQPPQASGGLNSNATFGNLATEAIQQNQSNSQHQNMQLAAEFEKSRKELTSVHEAVARLAENLLNLPGVGQFVSANDQLATHFKKQAIPPGVQSSSTSSATYYAKQKLKGTSEVILHICKQLQARVKECNQMTQEFKRMEQQIQQLALEKSAILSQQPSGVSAAPQHHLTERPSAAMMQPSFQVQAPGVGGRSQLQQQSLGSHVSHQQAHTSSGTAQPNQYRRQGSRGAAGGQVFNKQ